MGKNWPEIRLGSVLTQVTREERVLPEKDYALLGVRLDNRGPFLRETVAGANSSARSLFKVHENDFIYSRLFAWRGAFGIVSKDLDGCYVSNEFPIYSPNPRKIDLKFLLFWISRSSVLNEIESKCTGSTPLTRNRFKEHFFEELYIPLPPLPEQRKIVARIENVSQKLNEARKLQEATLKEIDALMDSELKRILGAASEWESSVMSDFVAVNPTRAQANFKTAETVSFVPMSAVNEVGGTIKEKITKPFYQVSKGYTYFESGDVIFAKITPCMQNGKSAIAENLVNGIGFGSTEFHVLRPGSRIKAEWLHLLVRSKEFRTDAATHFKGTAGQQRVPNGFLENKVITVPPLPEQERLIQYFKDFKEKLGQLGQIQGKLEKEITSILPSVLDKIFKRENRKQMKFG